MRICKDLLLDGFDSLRALSYVEKTDTVITSLNPAIGEVSVARLCRRYVCLAN